MKFVWVSRGSRILARKLRFYFPRVLPAESGLGSSVLNWVTAPFKENEPSLGVRIQPNRSGFLFNPRQDRFKRIALV